MKMKFGIEIILNGIESRLEVRGGIFCPNCLIILNGIESQGILGTSDSLIRNDNP